MMQTKNKNEEMLIVAITSAKGSFSDFPRLNARVASLLVLTPEQRLKTPMWQELLQAVAKCEIDLRSNLTESICELLLEVDGFDELIRNLPSANSITNLQRYIRRFPGKHADELLRILLSKSSFPVIAFYSLLNADTKGILWSRLLVSGRTLSHLFGSSNFSEQFFSRNVIATTEGTVIFIQKQVAFLTDRETMEKIDSGDLEKHFLFLQHVLLSVRERVSTEKSVEAIVALEEAVRVTREIPYHNTLGAFASRQNLAKQIEETMAVIKRRQPQPTHGGIRKKLCLVLHGTCEECGNPNSLSVLAEALRDVRGNSVCEFGGPGVVGSDTTIIADEAIKLFKHEFINWLGSLGNPPRETDPDFALFLAGYSRGAVNCFRVIAAMHVWLNDKDALLKDCPEDLQKILQSYSQENLLALFSSKVHVDFYAHDPVPGTPHGHFQSLVIADGWKDRERFAWPRDDRLKIIRRKLLVVAQHENRATFESLLDRSDSGVLGNFSGMEIQVLPGNHNAGTSMDAVFLRPAIRQFLGSCTSVDAYLAQLTDDLWQIDNGAFCASVNAQLITLSLMQNISEIPIAPTIVIGSRSHGYVIHLSGGITAKNKLDLYASTKKHMMAFARLTDLISDFGGGRSTRDVGQHPENYTRYNSEFFTNNDEAFILENNYPEIYRAIITTNIGIDVMAELTKTGSVLNAQLWQLMRENPYYANQVIMFLVAKNSKKLLSFTNVTSPGYFNRYDDLEGKKASDKAENQQQQLLEIIEKAQAICQSLPAYGLSQVPGTSKT